VDIVTINRDPSPSQLRQFGFVWLGFMTLFGGLAWFRLESPTTALILWVMAVVVPVVGWLVPRFMRLVFVGMSIAAWPIGFVVSHVVLALVYYLVLTPIGLVMRALGYDPMSRRIDRDGGSRWVERAPDQGGPGRYFRQF
jgi:ABC-type uncharacterized transport system permease subunit